MTRDTARRRLDDGNATRAFRGSREAGATRSMWRQDIDQVAIETDLRVARRCARDLTPFSPAWDAAVARIEDLERALFGLDPVSQAVRVSSVARSASAVPQVAA